MILPGIFACAQGEVSTCVDSSKREKIGFQDVPNTITHAYVPQYSRRHSNECHHQLVGYLGRETGPPIKQVFPNNFDDHIKMVGQCKMGIAPTIPARTGIS